VRRFRRDVRAGGRPLSIATAAAVVASLSVSCAAAMSPMAPVVTPDGVRFIFVHPDAQSVTLTGSFNQWSTSSHALTRARSAAVWTVVVPLPPGEHLFMYVVDGIRWISPEVAEDFVDDGFGVKNGVVVVRPNER
jgi:1,4-alpha-glucan branching enzyme